MNTLITNAGTGGTMTSDAVNNAIATAMGAFTGQEEMRRAHREKMQRAGERAYGARTQAMLDLAALSHKHDWTAEQVVTALKAATEAYAGAGKGRTEDQKKRAQSIATFKAHVKVATSDRARAHFARLLKLTYDGFTAETERHEKDSNAPTPLADAWKRPYLAVIALSREETVAVPSTIGDENGLLVAAHKTIDKRRLDFTKIKARLSKIEAELKDFSREFPADGLAECVEFLGLITAGSLRAAYENKNATEAAHETGERLGFEAPDADDESESESEDAPTGVDDFLDLAEPEAQRAAA